MSDQMLSDIVWWALMILIGFISGLKASTSYYRREMIRRGIGEYKCDPYTGKTAFIINTPP